MSGKIHLAQTHNEAGIKYDTGQKCNGPMEFGAGLFVQAGLFKISQVGCKVAEKKGGKNLLSFSPAVYKPWECKSFLLAIQKK